MSEPLCAGLDLGRVRDPSSFAVLKPQARIWWLVHLKTFRPEREDMVDALVIPEQFFARHPQPVRPRLAIDACGAGRTAAETAIVSPRLAALCDVYPLLPSHSDRPYRQKKDDLFTFVGKDPLVELLGDLFDSGQLRFAAGLPEAEALLREFLGLRQIPTRRQTRRTWSHGNQRKDSHDDRVFSLAYAAFLAWATRPGQPYLIPANRRAA